MSASVHVQSVQALDDLKGALSRFRGEAQDALGVAAQEIRRTLDWLQERLNHWQNEVRRRQEEVRRAATVLARCQAQARLQEAEAELANVRRWLAQVQQAVGAYELQARRLTTQLADDLPKADALLGRKIADLQAYLAVAALAGVGVVAVAGGAALIMEASRPASAPGAASEHLQDALSRLAGTTAGQPIADAIRRRGVIVRFGPTDDDAIAYFDPNRNPNEIVISETLQHASTGVLAAHLAHEGAHVQWDQPDSIDQEFHAFSTQAAVWNQVRGNESDEQCDWVSGMIALGEQRAKREIRRLYSELPG